MRNKGVVAEGEVRKCFRRSHNSEFALNCHYRLNHSQSNFWAVKLQVKYFLSPIGGRWMGEQETFRVSLPPSPQAALFLKAGMYWVRVFIPAPIPDEI